jgi:hypothetical protein
LYQSIPENHRNGSILVNGKYFDHSKILFVGDELLTVEKAFKISNSNDRIIRLDSEFKEEEISIKFSTLTGKEVSMNCKQSDTVFDLKKKLEEVEVIPCDQQRLIFDGKQLQDSCILSFYNIVNGSKIALILRLRGGMYINSSGKEGFDIITRISLQFKLNELLLFGNPSDSSQIEEYIRKCSDIIDIIDFDSKLGKQQL